MSGVKRAFGRESIAYYLGYKKTSKLNDFTPRPSNSIKSYVICQRNGTDEFVSYATI